MKYRALPIVCLAFLLGCNDSNQVNKKDVSITKDTSANLGGNASERNTTSVESQLPFVDKRDFETRPAISGTGTPHRSVEIKKNGDVYFSFEQENQADGGIIKEEYYAGKFTKYVKCVFKKWDNETSYYEITKDSIYEVDENNNRLTNEDCCNTDNVDLGDKCPCVSSLDVPTVMSE